MLELHVAGQLLVAFYCSCLACKSYPLYGLSSARLVFAHPRIILVSSYTRPPPVFAAMPKHTRRTAPSGRSPTANRSAAAPSDVASLTLAGMRALPAEVLRLHLSSRSLVTTGTKAAMASRLHAAVHADATSVNSPTSAPVAPHLERTVQSLVDKSLEGLEARLQASLRSMLQPTISSPAAPPAPPPSNDDDNISLPSATGTSPRPTTSAGSHAVVPPSEPSADAQTRPPAPNPDADDALVITSASPAPPIPLTTPPAVPAKLRQRILRGEYIDFDCLLPESMFPARFGPNSAPAFTLRLSSDSTSGTDGVVVAQPRPTTKRSVCNLSSWLEAWNIYAATVVSHHPQRAASLFAYQAIICQASVHAAPQAWLRYDSRFRALAAEDKTLRWDHKHNDLWLECFSLVAAPQPAATQAQTRARRPCTYCGGTSHFPDNCPSNPFRASRNASPSSGLSKPPLQPSPTAAPHLPPTTNRTSPFACRDHNQNRCSRPSCRFKHVCSACGDSTHIKWDCPQQRPN